MTDTSHAFGTHHPSSLPSHYFLYVLYVALLLVRTRQRQKYIHIVRSKGPYAVQWGPYTVKKKPSDLSFSRNYSLFRWWKKCDQHSKPFFTSRMTENSLRHHGQQIFFMPRVGKGFRHPWWKNFGTSRHPWDCLTRLEMPKCVIIG